MCYCQEFYDIWIEILEEQYPARQLVPFAKCNYNDDVACFEVEEDSGIPIIYIIHSFTDPGYEEVYFMATFEKWLEYAKEEARDYQISMYGELEEGLEIE